MRYLKAIRQQLMIRKLKTIDRPDGTRVIVDQRGERPRTIYVGPRVASATHLRREAIPKEVALEQLRQSRQQKRQAHVAAPPKPSLRVRIWQWTKAQAKCLLLARLKRMPQAAIDDRHSICNTCDALQLAGTPQAWCLDCGCGCNHLGSPIRNKLAVATERCPRRKWGVYKPGLRKWGVAAAQKALKIFWENPSPAR